MPRPAALKLIKAGMYDETVVQRLQAERQSLAIMDRPAIAKVFDAGIPPQGQPHFVMESKKCVHKRKTTRRQSAPTRPNRVGPLFLRITP